MENYEQEGSTIWWRSISWDEQNRLSKKYPDFNGVYAIHNIWVYEKKPSPINLNPMHTKNDNKEPHEFWNELQQLLNKHSKENGSNTPDFILADYLKESLHLFNQSVNRREEWHGKNKVIQNDAIEFAEWLDLYGWKRVPVTNRQWKDGPHTKTIDELYKSFKSK